MYYSLSRLARLAQPRRKVGEPTGASALVDTIRAVSSVGRAIPLHGKGRGFEPCTAHPARKEAGIRTGPVSKACVANILTKSAYELLFSRVEM